MNGEDQSSDSTVIPPDDSAPSPGPTQEQLADMPSAQLPPPPVRRAGLVKAPGPAPTQEQLADMPSAQLPPLRAKLAPGRAATYQGYATNFASQHDLDTYNRIKKAGGSEEQALLRGDNWIGAPHLGKVSTGNSYGIAVPEEYLRRHFGNDPANWRTARARVTTESGQTILVPFVDIGPGKKQQKANVIADITYPLSQGLNTGDKSKVTISYVPNAGPDYLKDRAAWYQEQGQIGNQFQGRRSQLQVGAEPSSTPSLLEGGFGKAISAMTEAPKTVNNQQANPDEHPIHQDMDTLSKWLTGATLGQL
jgi:hypothetical protein